MAGGYRAPKAGVDALVDRFDQGKRQTDALRSAAGILSAVIGKGGIRVKDGGSLSVEDGGDVSLGPGSRLVAIGDDTYVQILDDEFSIGTIGPDGEFTWPASSLRPDGILAGMSATEYAVFRVDEVTGDAVLTSSTGRVHLPYVNTGDSANTRILFDGTIQMVTSSKRYKRDIEDAEIDPATVLQMRGRTWRQRADVEADPETTTRYVGFIAEELHDLGLQAFVEYDSEGRPNAIRYDRLTVALQEVAKDQQVQLDMQAEQINALTKRLDALELGA